ncbi:FAD/NAD(P)-binding domain-containing protein [Neolentinus lepideus HHB14362 ss-1]|uniref:FAD/NAD(P)-binding domain-containing protein n=1 Tax=Neolentinus lepideus HHB14362 ss-1 TaxID=1314782 RepID=A0A165PIC0_9AGAM|nr:FAD/NAD(P)-binding domain-containing protein [Neolentinus lepideus HHB14362 ss-1]
MENVELLVVGAGWHGLAMAKTYLECHPEARVMVLDSQETVGGVWAKERLYPSLRTNNMRGTYEYSDFPLDDNFGVKPGEHIPGAVVHEYFHKYTEKFDLYRHIRFRTKVGSVERVEGGKWIVTASQNGGLVEAKTLTIITDKLVLATGLTSQPVPQNFKGSANFGAPLFHVKDLPSHQNDLTRTAKSVVVVGGTKSAWDAVYAFASVGIPVHWIIRKSGHGPAWMAPPYVTPLKIWTEMLVSTRAVTWFSPCVWGDEDGFGFVRRFLHGTRVGRWLVDAFWNILRNDIATLNGYDSDPETAKLKPSTGPLWHGTSIGILNHPTNVFEYVRNGTVKVHIEDVEKLSHKTVHLSSGELLPADAFIYMTGWEIKPSFEFLPAGIESKLGLPGASNEDTTAIQKADEEIFSRFPRLRDQPVRNSDRERFSSKDSKAVAPYRLYRAMVPPVFITDRSIVFCGTLQSFNTPLIAQTQSLWATAYLDGKLPLDSTEHVNADTVLHSQFCRWRCPEGRGKEYPDIVFDGIPYIDMLLNDMRLKRHRKKNILAECFQPYTVVDYRGVVDEWRTKTAV